MSFSEFCNCFFVVVVVWYKLKMCMRCVYIMMNRSDTPQSHITL